MLGYDTLGALGYVDGGKHPKSILDVGLQKQQKEQALGVEEESQQAVATRWDPLVPESAAWLPFPAWVMRGGQHEPPLFPETEVRTMTACTAAFLSSFFTLLSLSLCV